MFTKARTADIVARIRSLDSSQEMEEEKDEPSGLKEKFPTNYREAIQKFCVTPTDRESGLLRKGDFLSPPRIFRTNKQTNSAPFKVSPTRYSLTKII